MSINVIPWVMACAGAAWLALIAFRTGRNWISAAITGGLFALIITTFVFGLGKATSMPFSDRERATDHLVWTLISGAIVAGLGSLFTFVLWRKPGKPRSQVTERPPTTAPAPDEKRKTPA